MVHRTLFALVLAALMPLGARAEQKEIRIGVQPGLTYLALNIMQDRKLIEKHAASDGLAGVTSEFRLFSTGNVMNDAVLSGNIDVGSTGVPPFLILWDKTRGSIGVKALVPYNSLPLVLVTRNPNVHRVEDFTDASRIALPGVGSSSQAIILQMASAKAFGEASFKKLDPLTVGRGHPDAMAAMLTPGGEIDSHFSTTPYVEQELAVPGVHEILSSRDVYGGPGTIGMTFATKKFHDENPKLAKAFVAAMDEAMASIKTDKRAAAESYLRVSHDKLSVDQVLKLIDDPKILYEPVPRGTMKVAEFMHRTGTLKAMPGTWQELCFPEMQSRDGS